MTAALLLAALAVAVAPGPSRLVRSRRVLADLRPSPAPAGVPARLAAARLPVLGGLALGAALAVLVGGAAGLAVGAGCGVVAVKLLTRLEPAASRRLRARREADLPPVLDLLATALAAGLPVPAALAAVADAAGGPLAADLHRAGELSRLGAGPAAAWADYSDDPVLAPVARAAQRSADSGAALAGALGVLAAELRAAAALRADAAARRAGIVAMAPLGLCFLPAFICLGVVPVIVGIATSVLPGVVPH
jgi:pilus assembly protein TadC